MYDVDERDRVERLRGFPQCDVGAPMPCVVANEHSLKVAYVGREQNAPGEVHIVVATFLRPYTHMFGPPNDEAMEGHPLADRGLEFYDAFRVVGSSWIRRLERMNSVHERHNPEKFDRLSHYILTFHDSTFECVAEDYEFEIRPGDDPCTLSIEITP
jgi:hypothetical protein